MEDIVGKKLEKGDILDLFIPKGLVMFPNEAVNLICDGRIPTVLYQVKYGAHHLNFLTLFFARRYFNRLRKKYKKR